MIRHVPTEKPCQAIGRYGSCISHEVRLFRASCVIRDTQHPCHWHTNHSWDQPKKCHGPSLEIDRANQQRRIDTQHETCLEIDTGQFFIGYKLAVKRVHIPKGVPKQPAKVFDPQVHSGHVIDIFNQRARRRQNQFWVFAGDLCVGVMPRMIIAKINRWPDRDDTTKPQHGLVDPTGAKGRPMAGFMQGCKQVAQHNSVQQHRGP